MSIFTTTLELTLSKIHKFFQPTKIFWARNFPKIKSPSISSGQDQKCSRPAVREGLNNGGTKALLASFLNYSSKSITKYIEVLNFDG